MEPATIFGAVLAFMWVVFLWEIYLAFRQYRKYVTTTSIPEEVSEIMDPTEFEKSRLYKIDKARFNFVNAIYSQIETTAIIWFEMYAFFWYGCAGAYGEIVQSILFVVSTSVIQSVMGLPWQYYDTFIIEQKHGFNKQTLGFFIKDHVKQLFVSTLISCPLVAALVGIVQWGGDYFFVYIWLFVSVFIMLMMTVYPEFIAPLFDKYSPLPEGELRTKIEALAARLDYPLKKLLVVENSKRSSHSNAYLYGFWKNKRIVLYDTLLQDYTPVQREDNQEPDTAADDGTENELKKKKLGTSNDEVVAILGHELGHWSLGHVLKMLVIMELNMLVMFGVFQYLFTWSALYHAFGFHDSQPVIVGLMLVFSFVFAPYNQIFNFVMTYFTRYNEFGADRFSAELGYSDLLISALIKLTKDNLSFPVNDWLYSCVNHSHPPTVERIQAIRAIKIQ